MEVSGQREALAAVLALPEVALIQSWPEHFGEGIRIMLQSGFKLWAVQPVAQSLYRVILNYKYARNSVINTSDLKEMPPLDSW
jgi:hypothetical protein